VVIGWEGEKTVQYEGLAIEPESEELAPCEGDLLHGKAKRYRAPTVAGNHIFSQSA